MKKKIWTKRRNKTYTSNVSHSGTCQSYPSKQNKMGFVAQLQKKYGNAALQRLYESGVIQAKLTIGKPGDKYEREADNVADQVMNMPEQKISRQEKEEEVHPSPLADRISSLLQRQTKEEEIQKQPEEEELSQEKMIQPQAEEEEVQQQPEEEEKTAQAMMLQKQEEKEEVQNQPEEEKEKTAQRKSLGNKTGSVSSNVENGINSIRKGGQPLGESTRNFFESRFGADFGGVRVHTNSHAVRLARDINAKAFTVGKNVVFGSGQYSPDTNGGKQLLAHELTHVVQQNKGLLLQRKIKTNNFPLDQFFPSEIPPATKSNSTYSIGSGACYQNTKSQIISDMLQSPRVFKIKGYSSNSTVNNFFKHINARKGIIDFAAKKKYTFGAGAAFKMNPRYWKPVGNKYRLKRGVNRREAFEDVNKNPQKYSLACSAATNITMMAGSGFSNIVKDNNVNDQDWVPGDWGYIKNTNFPGFPIGREGENIINVSTGLFWGHLSKTNTYRSINAWHKIVKAWHGAAKLLKWRKRPKVGLDN